MALERLEAAIVYIIEGWFITGGNLFIIAAVMLRRVLRRRKELLIIVALSLGDMITGIAYFWMGIRRVLFIQSKNGTWPTALPPLKCVMTSPNLGFLCGTQCLCIMMVVVSIDRFVAVRYPARYIILTTSYVYKIMAITFLGYGGATSVAVIAQAWSLGSEPDALISPVCSGQDVVYPIYFSYHMLMQVVLSFASCIMYVGVIAQMHRKTQVLAENKAAFLKSKERQDRVTRLLSYVVLTTLLLFSIPYAAFVLPYVFKFKLGAFGTWLGQYSYALAGFNSISNVAIYAFRHPDIRRSIWALVCWGKFEEGQATVQPMASNRITVTRM